MGHITLSLAYPIFRWDRLGAPLTQLVLSSPEILRVLTESDIWRNMGRGYCAWYARPRTRSDSRKKSTLPCIVVVFLHYNKG